MTNRARLLPTRVPDHPAGVVLVLHGGASRRDQTAVSPTQLSVLRMLPVAARIAHAGRGRLAVFRLLNSTRGWDTSDRTRCARTGMPTRPLAGCGRTPADPWPRRCWTSA